MLPFAEILNVDCQNQTTTSTTTEPSTGSTSTPSTTSTTSTTTACPAIPAPTFSPVHGSVVLFPVSVTITSTLIGSSIRYTTDGSTPSFNSTLYTGPVSIASSAITLRAVTVAAGNVCKSDVSAASYTGTTTTTTTTT